MTKKSTRFLVIPMKLWDRGRCYDSNRRAEDGPAAAEPEGKGGKGQKAWFLRRETQGKRLPA